MTIMKVKILHITPHLGGGVGKVLLNYFIKTKNNLNYVHQISCLDYANNKAINIAHKHNFILPDNMKNKRQKLLDKIAKADIILIHLWNHPLLYDFLVREQLPTSRVIMWSHNSGLYPPGVFTNKILTYPDLFVFTTPVSYKTKEVQNLSNKQKKSLRFVWATGGVEHVKLVKPKKHFGFNIGYIGTVDYAKLHPNFLNICSKVNIPNVKFIVCGGPSENKIKKEVEKKGLAKKFRFTGKVSDISKYLSIFDIFGYPLAPYHYGTCDQSLQESMAVGVVPVVLSNSMENYMVKDGKTGIVAKSIKDYIQAIETLYNNKALRSLLSQNARKYALNLFTIDRMAREWEIIFKEALVIPKTRKIWNMVKKNKEVRAGDIFLESLGDYGKDFIFYCKAKSDKKKRKSIEKIKKLAKSANWQAKTRGTVHHYHSFFPNDRCLSIWSQLMKNKDDL